MKYNVNPELLSRIPLTARRVLEVGCGGGALGAAYQARNPQAVYQGVEIDHTAGNAAQALLAQVVIGDIAQPEVLAQLDAWRGEALYDAMVLGNVLECLLAPERLLATLRERMNPGGVCVACVANGAHYSRIADLLRGRRDKAELGARAPLHFFTMDAALEMFQRAGWQLSKAHCVSFASECNPAILERLLTLAPALGVALERLQRDLVTSQWVIIATNGPVLAPLTVAGFGLKRFAGVNEARIDHPLTALASLPTIRALWGANEIRIPPDCQPGIFILHRQFMNDVTFQNQIEALIQRGWLMVAEMDDDPHLWKEFIESDFYAYRAVHAVTVSTAPLAALVREWNPHVAIFPNAILALPKRPQRGDGRVRVFFGALNRGPDLPVMLEGIMAAAGALSEQLEFVIVHERALCDVLPSDIPKEYHPTLPLDKYLEVLASCDIALLPLADRPSNRFKSDLKFIECCATGVVPIFSPLVYGERAEHRAIGICAETREDWHRALWELVTDAGERTRRANQGVDYVKRQRMHAHQVEQRELWYRAMMAQRAELEAERQQRLLALRMSAEPQTKVSK